MKIIIIPVDLLVVFNLTWRDKRGHVILHGNFTTNKNLAILFM
jgi:hypothetical protein